MMNELFKITAEHDLGVGCPHKITMCDIKGTFAEEVFYAVESRFWSEIQGCAGCAFENVEEWEMPCAKCRRAQKDYWRAKA